MRRRPRGDVNLPLLEHIKVLRKVLIISAYAVALGTIVGWFLSDLGFAFLARPVVQLDKISFITTTPMEPVLVKIKVALVIGIVFALPILMWQIWGFVLPALKQNERKVLYLVVPSSILLFIGGAAFCFFFVLPVGIKFLLLAGSGGVASTPFVTKTSYLSFILTFLLTFGLVFQLPIVLLILVRIGLVSPKTLAKKRRWALFIIIILAAVLAPTPDLFTQALMAGPMYMLYEISIWLGYLAVRKKETAA
ncbi:MAG: twin-arginine translocase subunit TatC [Desulfitobacteriaceae bacterium]|nr:twin-arginine translocase subunit TatC [Desulfitobacteriaceae bacterium]